MRLSVGDSLGTYEILSPLGAGGMGEVYRARDTRLGRDVAIKVLPSDVAATPQHLARLEREARAVAGLNHPNIVTLFSVEDEDGVRFLTMELVDGQGLDRIITPGGLPFAQVLELSIQLADAVVAAHERGVIHRDLKPGNVMITRGGRVKVLDFGIAMSPVEGTTYPVPLRAARPQLASSELATSEMATSEEGTWLGTAPYMAPEQFHGGAADARTDLFSMGVVFYELATGRRPFEGASLAEVTSSILRDEPKPVRNARPDLPHGFEQLVHRCLEKDPDARYESAVEVYRALCRMEPDLGHGPAPQPIHHGVASIAVLPFVNRSRDEDDEYFSDGLADELLGVLAKIRGLRVAARSSAFQFKGKNNDPALVGRKLNVATLLDGSIRRSGNRVRVSVQLVKIADRSCLWTETYDRTLDDILAVQDDIAQSVVRELRATLGDQETGGTGREVEAEVATAARGRGRNPEAHRIYLQARYFINRYTREDNLKGIEYLKEALALEQDFALGWAMLGTAYLREADSGWAPLETGLGQARDAIHQALAVEPNLPEGHALMMRIHLVYEWDSRAAEMSMRRALELAPGNEAVLRAAADLQRHFCRWKEAVDLNRRAVEQDPLSVGAYTMLGVALHASGAFGEAETAYRKALELMPTRVGVHAALALALLAQGRGPEAAAEVVQESDEGYRLWVRAIVEHGVGRASESDEALQELIAKYADDSAYQIAEAYAARGDGDNAFLWLDRAYRQHDGGLATELQGSAYFRAFRDDPRWRRLLGRLGFDR